MKKFASYIKAPLTLEENIKELVKLKTAKEGPVEFTFASNETISNDIPGLFGFSPKGNGFSVKKDCGVVQSNPEIYGEGQDNPDRPKLYGCQGPLGPTPQQALEGAGYIAFSYSGTTFSKGTTTWVIAKQFFGKWLGTHFVNKYNPNNSLETKWLTPKKMGVATGSYLKPNEIVRNVTQKIDDHKLLTDGVKEKLKYCLELVNDGNTSYFKRGKTQDKLPTQHKTSIISFRASSPEKELTKSEFTTISKDFGEILCGIWCCKNIGYTACLFPTDEGKALIDFYGQFPGWPDTPISVKSGSGASTTMKNLTDPLIKLLNSRNKGGAADAWTKKEIDAVYRFMVLITSTDTMSGILQMHEKLGTGSFKELVAATGISNPTVSSLETWLQSVELMKDKKWKGAFKSVPSKEAVKKKLKNFYKQLGSEPEPASWTKYENESLKKQVGVIIGPLGMALIKILNEDEFIKHCLTKAARTIVLLQMNVDVNAKTMSFRRGAFKDFMFSFSWGGGTTNPHRNKFGFKAETFK
jgi:hypothetical protein